MRVAAAVSERARQQQEVLRGPTSAVVLSQVQAPAATAQPIKVPQFVPPPRLMPRPTFQPQVRLCKTRLQTLTPPQTRVWPLLPLPPALR